jgi:hypothetical protein
VGFLIIRIIIRGNVMTIIIARYESLQSLKKSTTSDGPWEYHGRSFDWGCSLIYTLRRGVPVVVDRVAMIWQPDGQRVLVYPGDRVTLLTRREGGRWPTVELVRKNER